ncbi:MAG: esterase/lipase family protein [Isosphaeraceae bacterium]
MAELVEVRNCKEPMRRGDVVFIHGLNGNARQYWFPPNEPDKYWPAWLGEDLPDVGVWSLSYENAAFKRRRLSLVRLFFQGGFAMPLLDRASSVLSCLTAKGIGRRPLVFIAHSMGGLLVKQVLRTANDSTDPEWRSVLNETKGVCFIATPHMGANLARWVSYFQTLLGTNVSVDDLRPHHQYLRDLNVWYRNFVSKGGITIRTISFYEMKPMFGGVLVVEPGDADPGVAQAGLHPLDEDHVSICKPQSKESALHVSLIKFIGTGCLQPTVDSSHSGGTQGEVNQPEGLSAAMAAKIVEGGMPSAEAIARYLIEQIDNLDCENVYDGLEDKVRNGIRDIVVYNIDQETVLQHIIQSAPVGVRVRKGTAIRHVTTGRKAFKLKVDSVIKQLELVVSDLSDFREQAVSSASPPARERATPNEPA